MKETTKIQCPECKHSINISDIIYAQISDEIKEGLIKKSEEDRVRLENTIRKMVTDEKENEIKLYKDELNRKSEQVNELNKTKMELERTQRQMIELRSSIEAEAETKLSSALIAEKERLHKEYDEKNNLKVMEKEHLIESLRNQIQVLTRKVDQGSMQLQGEVQEVTIEDYLKAHYPFDNIIEVKKGVKGADCLQEIHSRELSKCGSILYESKNTQAWSGSWIQKFKSDMQLKNANFGVIVTQIYPPGISEMTMVDGVWVCSLKEFRGLSQVLREAVILLKTVSISQENKGEKMQLLYEYLTSNEFKLQIQSIVEGFSTMQDDLLSERRAMETIWKKRQKQIDKVLINTTNLFGSIKGIAGAAVPEIKQLQLPTDKYLEDEKS